MVERRALTSISMPDLGSYDIRIIEFSEAGAMLDRLIRKFVVRISLVT